MVGTAHPTSSESFLMNSKLAPFLCSLMVVAATLPTSFHVTAADATANYLPPPAARGDWQTISPTDAGYDRGKLAEALDFARQQRLSGVVILYRGKILAEGYWNPDDLPPADKKANAKKNRPYTQRISGRDAADHIIEDVASAQ